MHIEEIAAAAEAADGTSPLDEATRLTLAHHPERVRSWVRDGGFALVTGGELSLVVHPERRNERIGTALLEDVLAEHAGGLSAWSHADHPAAARLAAAYGFENVRALWVMRRDLTDPLPDLTVPEGVEIREFRPGDEDEVVRVNAAAFVDHPEQGAMDRANLAQRMAQPWFDREGLLLATRKGEDRLLGLHWTKHHPDAFGEVYVVGIDPAAQGRGLGKVLTLAGLHHLRKRGATEVILYVESDNAPAITVYRRLGFGHSPSDTHVMYRRNPLTFTPRGTNGLAHESPDRADPGQPGVAVRGPSGEGPNVRRSVGRYLERDRPITGDATSGCVSCLCGHTR